MTHCAVCMSYVGMLVVSAKGPRVLTFRCRQASGAGRMV